MRRCIPLLALPALLGLGLGSARADLLDYVKKPEPKFAWKLKDKTVTDGATIYDLELTSQEWQKILWKHQLQVYQPKDVKPNATMLVYNTGGSANVGTIFFGMDLAKKIQAKIYDVTRPVDEFV